MDPSKQRCTILVEGDIPEDPEARSRAAFDIATVAIGKIFDAYPEELKPFAASAMLSAAAQLNYHVGGADFLRQGLEFTEKTLVATERSHTEALSREIH